MRKLLLTLVAVAAAVDAQYSPGMPTGSVAVQASVGSVRTPSSVLLYVSK